MVHIKNQTTYLEDATVAAEFFTFFQILLEIIEFFLGRSEDRGEGYF